MDKFMLLNFLMSSVVLGIVVAIPPGSVTVIACQRAIQFGFRNSLFFSIGSCLSDIFYIVLVFFGIANVISDNIYYKIILWFVCGLILILLGATSIVSLRKKNDGMQLMRFQSDPFPTFLSGILVTLTNPVTIVGWIAIAGNFFLLWNEKFKDSKKFGILSIAFIMIGVIIWFVPLTYAVSRLKKFMTEKLKMILIITANCFLILFGIYAFFLAINSFKDITY
jgi:L-lysine exporter family protein LysE/ArgO